MSEKYYIHDRTRGFVGNSMMWWRKNHCGYTCDVTDAHLFTREEATTRVNQADDLTAYTEESVLAHTESHVTDRGELDSLIL